MRNLLLLPGETHRMLGNQQNLRLQVENGQQLTEPIGILHLKPGTVCNIQLSIHSTADDTKVAVNVVTQEQLESPQHSRLSPEKRQESADPLSLPQYSVDTARQQTLDCVRLDYEPSEVSSRKSSVGICKFECVCGNHYTVACQLCDTAHCYKCGKWDVKPVRIYFRQHIRKKSGTFNKHSCNRCHKFGAMICPNLFGCSLANRVNIEPQSNVYT